MSICHLQKFGPQKRQGQGPKVALTAPVLAENRSEKWKMSQSLLTFTSLKCVMSLNNVNLFECNHAFPCFRHSRKRHCGDRVTLQQSITAKALLITMQTWDSVGSHFSCSKGDYCGSVCSLCSGSIARELTAGSISISGSGTAKVLSVKDLFLHCIIDSVLLRQPFVLAFA